MFFAKYYRWGDNDRRFGPFIYARDDRGYRPLALELSSGGREDSGNGCTLRISGFGHTLIVAMPPIIRPWRRWVDLSNRDWCKSEPKGYWDQHPREYGFSLHEGHFSLSLGAQTGDSSTTQSWGCFLPWTQWRHVRRSLYDAAGNHFWTEPKGTHVLRDWEAVKAQEDACPSRTFAFKDFDGEDLTVRTRIEEREWHFGTGWFKWLSLFRKPRISRYLDLAFSGETGRRKGSWKGGTVGHSIELEPGQLHEEGFRHYCADHGMKFMGEV